MNNIEHIASLNMILAAVAIVMVALLYYAKKILLVYRILIFFIGYNLFLTMISPKISVLNVLADDSKINEWATRGQIGDFIAGHFTALALIALLINISQMQNSLSKQDKSLKIQKEEMKLQREEMKLQREEMKDTAGSLRLQSKLYEKQNFENTFFQMLKLYTEVIDTIEYESTKEENTKHYTKKHAIDKYYEDFIHKLDDLNNNNIDYNLYLETYVTFMLSNHTIFDSYFRTIYRIIKYVDTYADEYKQIDKKLYINLLRAQLTSIELYFIFVNALDDNGTKFKKLIEDYALLKHLVAFGRFSDLNIEIIEKFHFKAFGDGYFNNPDNQKHHFNSEKITKKLSV